ncbi:spore coat associated protein CotJA [Bacilliculturomica massiliensis]|uniref:spore coat associated protein CotJA n=1 Tax=Bacilliculturomica massiliensis TaxID=1917867 RepID=UPI00102F78AC|nr:spore coat associated protein CotJA [Bacilliculturomica massiliensis]
MNNGMPGYACVPAVEVPDVSAAAMTRGETPLDQLPLAMAYVPMQKFGETYDGLRALERGTIFPDLDLPFCGRGVK